MVTEVSASSVTTDTLPAMDTLPCPDTAPARDCAARRPLYLPSMFWVISAVTEISPLTPFTEFATSVPVTSTVALFLSTLTDTPAAMELEFCARLIAIPVPFVRKLP